MSNRRINDKWDKIKDGDTVVSDYHRDRNGKLMPFKFKRVHGDRTKCLLSGTIAAWICFPIGEIE